LKSKEREEGEKRGRRIEYHHLSMRGSAMSLSRIYCKTIEKQGKKTESVKMVLLSRISAKWSPCKDLHSKRKDK